MIGAPNSLNLNCKVRVMKEAPGPSVSEEIADIFRNYHYNDVKMGAIASQITSLTIVYSIVFSEADQRKHQSSASLAFVRGIHRGRVNFPHKWPVSREMFSFDDVIMKYNLVPQRTPFPTGY